MIVYVTKGTVHETIYLTSRLAFVRERIVPMCAVPDITLYYLTAHVIYALFGSVHRASLVSVAELVWALLLSQSLHPSDLARSLPAIRTSHARQALRRVRRSLGRPTLSSKSLTPFLVRAVLRFVPDHEVLLVLDSTRCLCWEIFTLGIKFYGRVLPIAWAVLPYPWPKKAFTPTVIELINRTLECWPKDRPVHLLADRGFPSLKLFKCLHTWGKRLTLGYTIRLRASDWVRLPQGLSVRIADLIAGITLGSWRCCQASYQHRSKASPPAQVVFGRGVPTYPAHQMGPSDQARRLQREMRRIAHLLSKRQGQAPDTDRVWVLLTTESDCEEAVRKYGYRFSTEGTYRDLKSWDLEVVASHESSSVHLDGLIGLAAIGYFVQAIIGSMAGRATETEIRARQQQWTTTDRVSVFWRGRQVLHDPAYDWRSWLTKVLPELIHVLAPRRRLTNLFVNTITHNPFKKAA
jgi:hypothetical protein